jgi:uncharacterized protein (TIGR02246 family)
MTTQSSTTIRDREETAIRQLIAEAEMHQTDVERFLPLHTEDVVIVNIAGIRLLGRDAMHTAMTRAMETHLANVITRTEVLDISFATPDVAIVSCIKHVSDQNAGAAGELPLRGSLTYTLVKQQEGWRIALAQTTPLAI